MSWLDRILGRRRQQPAAERQAGAGPLEDDEGGDEGGDEGSVDLEAVVLPIEDSIDLHPFHPREIREVVRGYLDEAWERGFDEVRIIHGRGIGAQREAVRRLLERDPRIGWFGDAGADRGGWGATIARFVPREPAPEPEPEPPASSD